MDRVNTAKKIVGDALRRKNCFTELLEKIEKRTNIDRLHLVSVLALVIFLYLTFGPGGTLLANLIGFVYPAYQSIKALETLNKEDDTKWLTYWVVYGLLSTAEPILPVLFQFIPLYPFLKCIFYIYMMLPIANNGSKVIYEKFIRPHFLAHEKAIDQGIEKVIDMAGEFRHQVRNTAENIVMQEVIGKNE